MVQSYVPAYAKMDGMEHSWEPIGIGEVAHRFAAIDVDWWVAGGLAIDLFLGFESRPHADIDLEMFRSDREALFEAFEDWELFSAAQGALTRWNPGEAIDQPVFGIWGRPGPDAPWGVEVMLADGDAGTWRFRRDNEISLARKKLTRTTPTGIRYCTPEVQLLYKSKQARPKDDADLAHCLHRMTTDQRVWLTNAVERTSPGHPWAGVLEASLEPQHE
jgi:hypothetical protein